MLSTELLSQLVLELRYNPKSKILTRLLTEEKTELGITSILASRKYNMKLIL